MLYPCTSFMLGRDEAFGGGGSCHISVARNHELRFAQTSFEEMPRIVAIHGGMTTSVDRVTIELDSGEVTDADLFNGQVLDAEAAGFRFFLVFVDGGAMGDTSGQVVGYRGSEEVDRVDLCDPDLATVGGTCGP